MSGSYWVGAVAVLLAVTAPLFPARAEVIRHPGAAESPILAGVTLPAGSRVLLLSGQVPPLLDPAAPGDGPVAFGDTKTQTIAIFKKIDALLRQQGFALNDVVKLTVFLVGDPQLGGKLDFRGFSEAYGQYFGTSAQPNKAARSVVQVVALANPGFLVEIEATAAR